MATGRGLISQLEVSERAVSGTSEKSVSVSGKGSQVRTRKKYMNRCYYTENISSGV